MNIKCKQFILYAAILAISLTAGCAKTEKSEKTIFAMDTVMDIKAYGKGATEAVDEAEKEINRLDKILDRKERKGEIYSLNESGGAQISGDTKIIIEKALEMSERTKGAFDITVAPIMDLWGFYTKDYHVPTDEELVDVLKKTGRENVSLSDKTVTLKDGAQIDLGSIAKGYTSGKIAEEFRQRGISSAIISLGGNVEAVGTKPDGEKWTVALQNPDKDGFIGTLKVSDRAVITSGGYQRYFEKDGKRYHHIIDPHTGKSAQSGIKSVTVVSRDSAGADAASTALYVMGLSKARGFLQNNKEFDAVIMTDDNKIYITKNLESDWQSDYDFEVIK